MSQRDGPEPVTRMRLVHPTPFTRRYNANQIHHGADLPPGNRPETNYMCGLDHFLPEWRATADDGTPLTVHDGAQYVHNLSNPACRKWWVDTITNTSLGSNVAGVFADNANDQPNNHPGVSPERGAALLEGQQLLLDEVRQTGKYVIYNGIRYAATANGVVRDNYDSLTNDLPHASAGYDAPTLCSLFENLRAPSIALWIKFRFGFA